MLGTLSVSHEDRALELPPSRKVRALLAYLALAPRAVPRHRLCRLLWDNASDPRGELRWSLSKLRGVVGASRIASSKDSIRLDLSDSFVDALEVQRAAQAGIGTLTAARKRELLALFEGEQIVTALGGPTGKKGQAGKQAAVDQLTLFGTTPHPVVDELKKIDTEKMTPLEALTLLDRLVSRARQG